jgi:Diacylglycerol acyltransferase
MASLSLLSRMDQASCQSCRSEKTISLIRSPILPARAFESSKQSSSGTCRFLRRFSTVPPINPGRGVFTYNYGMLPYRAQVVSVVGNPIECPKVASPSHELIVEYQTKYLDELMRLYSAHKDEYYPDAKTPLQFIE